MPTGYTADVGDGKVTDFNTFALRCARAMGALIMMRDDDMDAPIPEEFKPSDYNAKALVQARADLVAAEAMSLVEAEAAAEAEHSEALKSWRESRERTKATLARYQAMRAKVFDWQPPTADHVEFRKFMVDQLDESIRFDCNDYGKPKMAVPPEAWRDARIEKAKRDIAYHEEAHAKELERTKSRNEWVRALRESLK